MELIILNNNIVRDLNVVATIGTFDGLHKGHLELLNKTIGIAKTSNLKSAVITFDFQPDFILNKTNDLSLITPFDLKKEIIEKLGFDYLIIISFTEELSKLSPNDFVNKYLIDLGVKKCVVGFDFTFGYKKSGTATDINNLSCGLIETTVIEEVELNNRKIGSSWVKKSLNNGDVELARILLGRPFEITGKVIKGKQIGRTIDVPTANVSYDKSYVLLKTGVYATEVVIDEVPYAAITNIGHNPSFNYTKLRSLESHIIGFSGDLYDKKITIKFLKYLRDEQKFSSIVEFKNQIEKDKNTCLEIYLNNQR